MIEELQIQNFKCFKDKRLPLSPITIISGGNGVGKSSVIQALLLLRQAADQLKIIDAVTGAQSQPKYSFPVRLNGPYRLALGNSQGITNSEIDSGEITLGVRSSHMGAASVLVSETFEADMLAPSMTLSCQHNVNNTKAMLRGQGGSPIFAREFHYLVAERQGPRDLSSVADEMFASTGFGGEFTADAIDKSERLSVALPLQLTKGDLFKTQLENWMRLISPGVRFVTTPYPAINKVGLSIERAGTTSLSISPTNTGFGISYSLPIVVSGLIARPGTMMIVENPEAHLHPAAQSAIGTFLACVASSGVQVLVETHSENVINGVRIAGLQERISSDEVSFLFLSPQEGDTEPSVTNLKIDELGEMSQWPKGFFDQQSTDLAELLKLRRAKTRRPSGS